MIQFILFIVVIYIWFKSKAAIKRAWEKVRGSAKVDVRVRPGTYRNYTPLVNITEIVHFEVLVKLGLAKTIIEENFNDLQQQLLEKLPESLTMGGFCVQAKKEMTERKYEHAAVFGIFFDELDKTYQNKSKLKTENILKAIEFALEDE